MGWLDGLGNLFSGAMDTVRDADYSWLDSFNPANFNLDVSKWLESTPDLSSFSDAGAYGVEDYNLGGGGSTGPSMWDSVGKVASQAGGALWDSAMKDPMRTLGGLGGGAAMLYGMLSDEGKVKAPSMSPAQERMMALAEEKAGQMNQDDEVTAAYKARVLKALNGEGDVDPRLIKEQADQRAALEARLYRELGSGAFTSGQNNKLGGMVMNNLDSNQNIERFTNARQILTQDEQSRQGAMNALNQGRQAGVNSALAGFKGLGDYAQMGLQANMFNKAKKAEKYKNAASSGGALLGYSFPRDTRNLYGTAR
jgi:hypothetical protein